MLIYSWVNRAWDTSDRARPRDWFKNYNAGAPSWPLYPALFFQNSYCSEFFKAKKNLKWNPKILASFKIGPEMVGFRNFIDTITIITMAKTTMEVTIMTLMIDDCSSGDWGEGGNGGYGGDCYDGGYGGDGFYTSTKLTSMIRYRFVLTKILSF